MYLLIDKDFQINFFNNGIILILKIGKFVEYYLQFFLNPIYRFILIMMNINMKKK